MPKETFFRLPPEKRQRILDAAAEEFTEYRDNYEKSSVKRIAERADIAIGSIYKYFYDKNDLFLYLYNANKEGVKNSTSSDTFYNFSQKEGSLENFLTPTGEVLADIILKSPSLFQDLTFNHPGTFDEYFSKLHVYYENDLRQNHLRQDIDEELAAYMYASLEFVAYQYCRRKGLDPIGNSSIHTAMADLFFFGLYRDGIEEDIKK